LTAPIVGGIYLVADSTIVLLPAESRAVHDSRRPVLVLSGSETNADPNWVVVLACPISSSTTRRTKFCVKLSAGEGNVTGKCWVRIPAVQALMKSNLEDHQGVITENRLAECYARLVEYMGLTAED
jgi:mRNA-degrading endonuclease toxin of MazEF toxin-antitoxin module